MLRECKMDVGTSHLLSKLDDITDMLRNQDEVLRRIEKTAGRRRSVDWGKVLPVIGWTIALISLLIAQIPLPQAVEALGKLSRLH
jgi:hypothetical protein